MNVDSILKAAKSPTSRSSSQMKALVPQKSREIDTEEIRATLGAHLNDWTTMARTGVAEARRLLREVLVDRIVFRPIPAAA